MEFEYSTRNPGAPLAYASLGAMNTVMEIVVVHLAQEQARTLCRRMEELTGELEGKLSRHISGSILSRINEAGSGEPVEIDEETYWLVELCETMRRATEGYFDIAALSAERTRPAYKTDPKARTLELVSGEVMLDTGAFAKGYALDMIKKEMQAAGVKTAFINFGNSSILALGTHPFGEEWPVTVGANPVGLRDGALSVSGMSPSGRAHIVDPHTGHAAAAEPPIAVRGRSALVCEILSTALYAAPRGRREQIAAPFEGYEVIGIATNENDIQ